MVTHVLIAGTSTRAAAESAANAGFAVTALDAFGDLDQHAGVRSLALPRDFGTRFTAHAAARAAREVACDVVAYLSNFENHPRAVETLASRRVLWGNPPDVLRRVRDPRLLSAALRRRGFAAPLVRVNDPNVTNDPNDPNEWMIKPFRSGGGRDVRPWQDDARVRRSHYLQERIEGTPASIVFVAAHGHVVPLGVSRQLVGDPAFGMSGYGYCGNVLAPADDSVMSNDVVDQACELAGSVAEEFGLVGLNGIDFIIRNGEPLAIEVNPRWSASMELVERTYGLSMFGMHARACIDGSLPTFDLAVARQNFPASGKAIVFAREDLLVGDTATWLGDPSVRDVPRPGDRIEQGQPVCTVFATGENDADCYDGLVRRAGLISASPYFQGLVHRGS